MAIDGLGWFSVQGKGFVQFYLNIPADVKYHVREMPMRPFEIKNKGGLDSYKSQKSRYISNNKQHIDFGKIN